MPKPIRSILAAAGLLAVAALAAAGVLVVAESPAHADCTISGPSSVVVNQSFTLCGPSIRNSTYEWSGPGLVTSEYGRCVDVGGLDRGAYEFLLIRRVNGVEVERCTRIVNVGGSTGGVESCNITGPTTIDAGERATLCAPQDGLHSYTWSGPNGFTSNAGCITVSAEGTYTLNSRNRITGSSRTCTHRLDVNGYGGGNDDDMDQGDCTISGPSVIPSGASVALCAPSFAGTSYRWTGPNGFVSSSRCINADDPGTYYLTMRNTSTGYQRRCTRTLTRGYGGGGNDDNVNECGITGPRTIPAGSSATICAPSYGNSSYRWTGPDGFVATSRCIQAESGGTYWLTVRNLSTGRVTRCSTALTVVDQGGNDNDNPDRPYGGNCPRNFQYWRRVAADSRTRNGAELSRREYLDLAREVDARSSYFNWSNDAEGLYQALNPTGGNTLRKQVIRQYAALLANVVAGEAGITSSDDDVIGLDTDTRVSFGGARTIGELIALTDRLLAGNRGDFARLNSTLNRINRGQGIPTSCQ
jgi:hypothetical protein